MDVITAVILFLIVAFLITITILYFTGYISKLGPSGPTGPSGIPGTAVNTGATGPTGPATVILDYANIKKTLTTTLPYQMNSRDTVVWDDTYIINGNVKYNASIPGLMIDPGTYLINFGYSNVISSGPISMSLQIGADYGPNLTLHGLTSTGQSLSVIRKITASTFITVINSSTIPIIFQDTVNAGSSAIYITIFRLD